MGMIACYTETDKVLLDRLKTLDSYALSDGLEELLENEELEICDIDKMWDGLHCLLTGVSGTTPIQDNLLSESVIGTTMFIDTDDADFISYIYPERLSEILAALDAVDIEKLKTGFSAKEYASKNIYPDIWLQEDSQGLLEELISAFQELKAFYRSAVEKKSGIIVSIM